MVFKLLKGLKWRELRVGIVQCADKTHTKTITQTLFRWDQVVGLKRADKSVAKAEAVREAAQQDLIIRVAQRYFDVLAAEDRLTSIHADRQAIARRLEQAKQELGYAPRPGREVMESTLSWLRSEGHIQ